MPPHSSHMEPDSLSDNENLPDLNANSSPADLVKIAQRYQLKRNTAEANLKALRCKLGDVTNNDKDNASHSPAKCPRVHSRSQSPDIADEDKGPAESTDTFVYQSGHKFFLTYGPWIHLGEAVFDKVLDEAYSAVERFENEDSRAQGQLQEIWSLLRWKFGREALQQKWVRKMFIKEINAERYNMASRIRNHCAAILQVHEVDLMNAETRKTKFRNRIDWVENVNGGGSYSAVDVEILHKNYGGEYSLSSIFLNPTLMGLYIALIRGPKAGKSFVAGHVYIPHTETMAQMHGIRNITLGAIVMVSILARWALSSDESLQPVGMSTGIHYFDDYEEYLRILETGLHHKKKSVCNIIREWDSKVFPNTDSSLLSVTSAKSTDDRGMKRAMDVLEADSDEEDPGNGQPEVAAE